VSKIGNRVRLLGAWTSPSLRANNAGTRLNFRQALCDKRVSADHGATIPKEMKMQLRAFVTSLPIIIGAATPLLAAEYWVSQNPADKHCKIVETMPDGKTSVMIGATSYPTKDEAKEAKKAAWATGQCVKKEK
jgi:hypothetical protein